jgi:hypothetical protein
MKQLTDGLELLFHRGGSGSIPGHMLCGICGGQSGVRASFLKVLRIPLPILIPPTALHQWSASSPTPPHPTILY